MAQASFVQTSFLGGEWSPYAQGRLEDKVYREGMNICKNGYPIEAGSWTRRQGTRYCGPTRYGQAATLWPMFFAENQPYTLEFTNLFLRLWQGPQLAATNDPQTVVAISGADPAVVQTATAHGWTTGNMVYFLFDNSQAYPGAKLLFLRQFVITVVDTTNFSIADPITGQNIDGSQISIPGSIAQVVRVNEISSPYTSVQLSQINKVQAESTLVTLQAANPPQALIQTTAPSAGLFAQFSFSDAVFIDGPYQDPNTVGYLSANNVGTTPTLTAVGIAPFTSTDVGRQLRLFSEPNLWLVGTGYTTGNVVKGPDGLYYQALANSTGSQPDLNPTLWAVDTSAAIWTWATITTVNSSTSVVVAIQGVPLLYSSTPINTFRMGLYSETTGYPTCGVWHEGRLWLAGAQGNRIDASMNGLTLAAGTYEFSPTSYDGTVSDNNGIAYVFNAEDVDEIFWLQPDNSGIVCGTQGGEWMIAASTLNDPLTPTSIQAHRRSKYKCANIQAVHAGLSLLFVQANQLRTMEYVADVFSGKFLGRNLNVRSSHLTTSQIEQIVYQQDKAPVLWERNGNGQLIGTTYKRESSFTSEAPTFNGWHEHVLGSTRIVESLSVGPSVGGNLESLTMVTNQTDQTASDYNIRYVEIMTDMFDENNTIFDAWFLDAAVTPSAAVENSTNTNVTFYGMTYLAGETVSVFAAGLDLGDYVVASDGSITVPINSVGGQYSTNLFTDALITDLFNNGVGYGSLAVPLSQVVTVQNPYPGGENIQSYISSKITTCTGIIDDFVHGRMISMWYGSGSSGGLAVFNRATGAVIIDKTAGQIMTTTNNQITSDVIPSSTAFLGSDGYLYCNSDSSNSSVLRKINPATLDIVASFGAGSGSFRIDNGHMAQMANAVSTKVYGTNYLIYTGLSTKCLSVINIDNMSFAGHLTNYAESTVGQICLGENISNGFMSYAAIYSISCPAADSTTSAGVYRTIIDAEAALYFVDPAPPALAYSSLPVNPGINTSRIAQISPADVDPTWSHFRAFTGPLYDQTDGNLIAMCNTGDSVTNTCYVIKINSQTGAIMWGVPITGTSEVDDKVFHQGIIQNGLCIILNGASATFNIINTELGTLVSANTNSSITAYGSADSNDIDGSLCSYGSWNGSTLYGANGTTAFSNQAFKVQTITGFPGNTTMTQNGYIPAVIGYTYTSQGQLLRPQAPDATGARQGPGFGKTRRLHRYALQMANSQGLSAGTNFANLYPVPLRDFEGAPTYAPNVLFTGLVSEVLQDTYTYDGMFVWQVTRPYPCNIMAAGSMIETEDR